MINVFAGARRIAVVIGLFWVAMIFVINWNPRRPSVVFVIERPDQEPRLVLNETDSKRASCPYGENVVRSVLDDSIVDGKQGDDEYSNALPIDVCFRTFGAKNDGHEWRYLRFRTESPGGVAALDPVRPDSLWDASNADAPPSDRQEWMKLKSEAQAYIDSQLAIVSRQVASDSVRTVIRHDIARQKWTYAKGYAIRALEASLAGLAALFGLTVVVGWIARGFLGISRGTDFRT